MTATANNPKIRAELQRSMRDDARLAAMIIVAEPEAIGEEPIIDFLRKIKCVRPQTITQWLSAARINPLMCGGDLTREQRDRLARQLIDFWKAGR